MITMWTASFWKDAAERAFRTVAQTAGALLVAAGTDLLTTNWVGVVSAAGMAGLLSLLFSVGGETVHSTGRASFLD